MAIRKKNEAYIGQETIKWLEINDIIFTYLKFPRGLTEKLLKLLLPKEYYR